MSANAIKVTGISDELLALIDSRVRERHAVGRSEYIRELIRQDVLGPRTPGIATARPSFRGILRPVHEETASLGLTKDQADRLIEAEREGRLAAPRSL